MIIVRKEQLGTDGKRFAYPGKAFTDLDAAARYAAYFAAEQAGVPGTWIVLLTNGKHGAACRSLRTDRIDPRDFPTWHPHLAAA